MFRLSEDMTVIAPFELNFSLGRKGNPLRLSFARLGSEIGLNCSDTYIHLHRKQMVQKMKIKKMQYIKRRKYDKTTNI